MKQCKWCKEHKPDDEMKKDKRYVDGLAFCCKKCHNSRDRKRARFSVEEKLSWPEGYRICIVCEEMLPYDAFGKDRTLWKGIANQCKKCRKPISKRYYDKWLKDNPEMRMLVSARSRAKRYNYPFDITIEDIVIPEFCPVLGIKLERNGGSCNYATPSLDKMIPELGYVKGNINVISWRANWIKQNATLEEITKLVKWMSNDSCTI